MSQQLRKRSDIEKKVAAGEAVKGTAASANQGHYHRENHF